MATSLQLRRANRNSVYKDILEEKETTKQLLASRLKLSFPTVSQILNELEEEGLIACTGESKQTGGRKAQIIASRPDVHVAIGMDITANHINLVLVNLEKRVLRSERKQIRFEPTDQYCQFIHDSIEEISKDYKEQVLGLVVSLPAIVRADGKTLLYAPLLKNTLDLYYVLEPYIPYPFYLVNDASAGAFSEISVDRLQKDFVYLMLSNTVGGALILDGKIVQGRGIRSGEFGHMTLVPGGRKCYCGQKGCVDAYCSALRLSDRMEDFFEKLSQGDEETKKIWDEYLDYLVIVLNNLQIGLNQEIVIGGYVGWFIEPYIPELKKRVEERCCFKDENGIQLSAGRCASEASAVGAALLVIEEFIEKV